jgi:hypothetical protein
MIGRIAAIERVAHGSYRVSLETSGGDAIDAFVFKVADDDIEGLTPPENFEMYVGPQSPPVKQLFNAIWAFHRAQSIVLPPWE